MKNKKPSTPLPEKPDLDPQEKIPAMPRDTGSQAAYDQFLPTALALDTRDVELYRIDAALALHNVQEGVQAVLPHEPQIQKDLPKIDITELRSLPLSASRSSTSRSAM